MTSVQQQQQQQQPKSSPPSSPVPTPFGGYPDAPKESHPPSAQASPDLGENAFAELNLEIQSYPDFDSMGLKLELLRGIYAAGYENPSPIQKKAIVPCIQGHDVLCQAQSGTGKTATFCTAILERVDQQSPTTQALILSPTRELAVQNYDVASLLAIYTNVSVYCSIGGTDVAKNARDLRRNPHVVVGTPGRCLDGITRGHLDVSGLKMLVLDEMDVLLSVGFNDSIYDIFVRLPPDVQVILVSATMPPEVLEVSKRFMRNPVKIMIKKEAITLSGIRQYAVDLDREDDKFLTLCDIFASISIGQCIIFVNSGLKADWLGDQLDKEHFSVGVIHGRLSTDQRNAVIRQFKNGEKRVLLSTDVLARGFDVQGVGAVVNFDMPMDKENYIHRVGRCGRYGRKGFAINFVTPKDQGFKEEIERYYSTFIAPLPADPSEWM